MRATHSDTELQTLHSTIPQRLIQIFSSVVCLGTSLITALTQLMLVVHPLLLRTLLVHFNFIYHYNQGCTVLQTLLATAASEPLRKDPTNELTLRVRLDY